MPIHAGQRNDSLSDVSLISHDRRDPGSPNTRDRTFSLSDSDKESNASGKKGRNLLFSSISCALCTILGIYCVVMISGRAGNSDWAAAGAWGAPTVQFKSLGAGLCGDRFGKLLQPIDLNDSSAIVQAFSPAVVLANGSSEECRKRCEAYETCTGFTTYSGSLFGPHKGGCRLVTETDGYPSSHNGNVSFFCFWRHNVKYNSEGVYKSPRPAVPKLIWSYWKVVHKEAESEEARIKSLKTSVFLKFCHESFKKLNPGWQVMLLNQKTVWQYITKEDLPTGFDRLSIQHQSDAIRLAVIVKYGGVWLDASTLLLQPLSAIVGDDPDIRSFYVNRGLVGQPVINARFQGYTRYTAEFHIENWFFAAPPQDPFMVRTLNCVKRMHVYDDSATLKEYPDIFSARQLEDLDALGIWEYLATDACMYKVLDEDLAMMRWWLSTRVRRINFLGHLNPLWFADPRVAFALLFQKVSPEMTNVLTGGSLHLIKFTGSMRNFLLQSVTPMELWGCDPSTWSTTISSIGLLDGPKCAELRFSINNSWNATI